MNGSYLLDTNIIIALFAREAAIQEKLDEAGRIFLCSIVIGELWYGARKSGRPVQNLARVEQFVAANPVLSCDTDTARFYGEVKNALRLKGRPLPENDMWIAALALQHDLIVATRDAHFYEVAGLKTVAW